jgi:hypothetical protein
MRGARTRHLLRESSGPQMEMTGPVQQKRMVERIVREFAMGAVDHVYTLTYTGTDIFATDLVPQILADARAGKFDVLLIAYASRFARDLGDAMDLLEGLIELGVAVYFCKEDVLCGRDKSWLGKIGPHLLEAHNFSDALSEQREETILANWAENKNPCGRAAWGYRWNDDKPARIVKNVVSFHDAPLWQKRAWCFEEYAKGLVTLTDLANILNAEGYRTTTGRLFEKVAMSEILRNPIAKGVLRHHIGRPDYATFYRDDLRIVSDDLFDEVQQLIARRKATRLSPHRVKLDHVFRDLAVCSACGERYWMHGHMSTKLYISHRTDAVDRPRCRYWGRFVSEEKLLVQLDLWFSQLRLPADAAALVERFLRERPGLRQHEALRARLKEREAAALEAYLEKHITKETWLEQKAIVEQQRASLPRPPVPVDLGSLHLIENLGELWRAASRADRSQLARRLFERVVVDPGEWGPAQGGKRRRRPQPQITEILVRPSYRTFVDMARACQAYVGVEPTNHTYPKESDEVRGWRAWLAESGALSEAAGATQRLAGVAPTPAPITMPGHPAKRAGGPVPPRAEKDIAA